MAIETYKLASGATRYKAVAYLEGNKKTTQRGFKTKKEAKRWIAEQQVLGKPKKRENLTFGEVVDMWLDDYKPTVKPGTYVTTYNEIKSVFPMLPRDTPINSITDDDIKELLMYLVEKFTTYNMRWSRLKAVFRYAKSKKLIDENPCIDIKLPKAPAQEEKYEQWTIENLNDFLEACKKDEVPMAFPLFRMLAYTGMRTGELIAMNWSDLDGNQLHIKRTMTRDYDARFIIGDDTKTPSSKRIIALDQETLDILLEWKNICPSRDRMFPCSPAIVSRWMHRIIRNNPHIPDNIPHNLRHLHCTILLDANANIKDVQERLGHSKATTTLNVYAHSNPNKSLVADIFTDALKKSTI